jgi:fatty-acyl-CoA synthase
MRVINPETGEEVPTGESGELLIWGPHVCSGYWRNPEATADSIKAGWFHTGDMVHKDQDGFFYIDGRYKDMIKSGGENIYAAEVEAVYKKHPAVKDAALIGKAHEKWGEVGLMVLTLEEGGLTTESDLKSFALISLAKYKIPKEVIFADDLPYSAYGKVEKAKLREKYLIKKELQ